MTAGGKGHAPRPFSVSADEYASRFDAIFGTKQMGHGRAAQASGSNPDKVGSTPTAPANPLYIGDYNGVPVFMDPPDALERLYQVQTYVDNATG